MYLNVMRYITEPLAEEKGPRVCQEVWNATTLFVQNVMWII